MTLIALNHQERTVLERLAARTDHPRQLCRAQTLLWLDDGQSPQEVADLLRISRQTIYNWAARFQQRSDQQVPARLLDAPRCGRPPTVQGVIDRLIEATIDCDPRQIGYRSTVWTAALLVTHLREKHAMEVSRSSVRLALGRLRIRWKRPRHQLALRSATWRQAKGG